MPRADLAGIFAIVVEVPLSQQSILITDETVATTREGLNST
jgi:hypothetical protein